MSAAKTADAHAAAAAPSAKTKAQKPLAPTPEAHHVVAAHHAAAQHHHLAAAHALKTGKNAEAREHAAAAVEHAEAATDKNDDIVLVYEVWTY